MISIEICQLNPWKSAYPFLTNGKAEFANQLGIPTIPAQSPEGRLLLDVIERAEDELHLSPVVQVDPNVFLPLQIAMHKANAVLKYPYVLNRGGVTVTDVMWRIPLDEVSLYLNKPKDRAGAEQICHALCQATIRGPIELSSDTGIVTLDTEGIIQMAHISLIFHNIFLEPGTIEQMVFWNLKRSGGIVTGLVFDQARLEPPILIGSIIGQNGRVNDQWSTPVTDGDLVHYLAMGLLPP